VTVRFGELCQVVKSIPFSYEIIMIYRAKCLVLAIYKSKFLTENLDENRWSCENQGCSTLMSNGDFRIVAVRLISDPFLAIPLSQATLPTPFLGVLAATCHGGYTAALFFF